MRESVGERELNQWLVLSASRAVHDIPHAPIKLRHWVVVPLEVTTRTAVCNDVCDAVGVGVDVADASGVTVCGDVGCAAAIETVSDEHTTETSRTKPQPMRDIRACGARYAGVCRRAGDSLRPEVYFRPEKQGRLIQWRDVQRGAEFLRVQLGNVNLKRR